MEDTQIVDMYLNRNEDAIKETSEKYGYKLVALSNSIVNNFETAKECENDTYMQAWNLIPPHEPRDYLYIFLARIVRHISLSCCRKNNALKRKSFIAELSTEMEQCIPSPDNVECKIDEILLGEAINLFLSKLNQDKRKIFVRRYWYLESIEDISLRFGISTGKVKTTLFRCRKKLREYLEKEGFIL